MAETALELPVRLRNVVSEDGPLFAPFVHCPREGRSIDALRCTGCARLRSVEWVPEKGGTLACVPGEDACPRSVDPRADVAEAAARCALHEVVDPVTFCVRPSMRVGEVRDLFAKHGLRAAPVVDDELRLVGVISRSDLMTGSAEVAVADVMPARTHALPEHAPVGFAIALMAFENVSEVPVVTDDGEIVGIFHALSALRWTAEHMGYVRPSLRRFQGERT